VVSNLRPWFHYGVVSADRIASVLCVVVFSWGLQLRWRLWRRRRSR